MKFNKQKWTCNRKIKIVRTWSLWLQVNYPPPHPGQSMVEIRQRNGGRRKAENCENGEKSREYEEKINPGGLTVARAYRPLRMATSRSSG